MSETSETYEQKVERLVKTSFTPEGIELVRLLMAELAPLATELAAAKERLAEADSILRRYFENGDPHMTFDEVKDYLDKYNDAQPLKPKNKGHYQHYWHCPEECQLDEPAKEQP